MARTMYATEENDLATRLKVKFSDRGVARVGTLNNTRAAVNPFEDVAEYADAKAATRTFTKVKTKKEVRAEANRVAVKERFEVKRNVAMNKKTPFASGAYGALYARASSIRVSAVDYEEKAYLENKKIEVTQKKRSVNWDNLKTHEFWIGEDRSSGEKKIKLPKINRSIILGIVIAVVILFALIYSFSQITQIKNEISVLENTRQTLTDDISSLKLEMDLKEDVRTIEDKAEDLGMVKSSKVESKYVSLSSGERIEVVEDESAEDAEGYGVLSTLMSSVSSNWDNLVDYFN